jgi:hypothetical protein
MAFVRNVELDDRTIKSIHPTQVTCKYIVSETNGKKILQINTYGSDTRLVPGKLSQTLQFDEAAAKQLAAIISREF